MDVKALQLLSKEHTKLSDSSIKDAFKSEKAAAAKAAEAYKAEARVLAKEKVCLQRKRSIVLTRCGIVGK
jgi:hypothetical protein